jgi:hypothetical protein
MQRRIIEIKGQISSPSLSREGLGVSKKQRLFNSQILKTKK